MPSAPLTLFAAPPLDCERMMETMHKRCHFAVVDAFPTAASGNIESTVGAIISCWLREDLGTAEELPEILAQRFIGGGWMVGRILSTEMVSRSTYGSKIPGRAEFNQALQDGFVAHSHVRAREVMPLEPSDSDGDAASLSRYRSFVDDVRQKGEAYSLFHAEEQQWAIGTSFDGDDFTPLWSAENEASEWRHLFPGSHVRHVSLSALVDPDGGLLERISRAEHWVAIGVDRRVVTTHPLMLRHDLALT